MVTLYFKQCCGEEMHGKLLLINNAVGGIPGNLTYKQCCGGNALVICTINKNGMVICTYNSCVRNARNLY